MIFPDRASLHMVAIEDNDYKEDKINCTNYFIHSMAHYYISLGQCLRF